MENPAAIVAIASAISALITLISNLLLPGKRAQAGQIEADTSIRRTVAETESEAIRTINQMLRRTLKDLDECRDQEASIVKIFETFAALIEKQTAAIETLTDLLTKETSI